MIDLSKEFYPVPKVFKVKKQSKPIKQIGKKGKLNLEANIQMKKDFEALGITECEVKLKGCWKNNALTFAHLDKRRYLKKEDLITGVLACTPCHMQIEKYPREKMKLLLENIIKNRK
jgi:hypothetical protein